MLQPAFHQEFENHTGYFSDYLKSLILRRIWRIIPHMSIKASYNYIFADARVSHSVRLSGGAKSSGFSRL